MKDSNRILLLGATSLIGWNLYQQFPNEVIPVCNTYNKNARCKNWLRANLENEADLVRVLESVKPAMIIFCGGICDVEKCQQDEDWAYELNVTSIKLLLTHMPPETRFVYCSSDHVFGGNGRYTEKSIPCPISTYGQQRVEAEKFILDSNLTSLIVRYGLPIGESIDGKTGHLDWLKYRSKKTLPITIVHDEFRSAIWADILSRRTLDLAKSTIIGIRHIVSTNVVSRIDLADFLIKKLNLVTSYTTTSRHDLHLSHLGRVELASIYIDELSNPLPSVVDY